MVEFVVTRAGTVQDDYILNKIGGQVKKDALAGIIVLVPPQATLMTENQIMRSLQLPGLMGVQVMGPEKLTQRILDSVGGRARPVIDAPAKSMIVKLLMNAYSEKLPTLGSCIKTQNISADIADIISEFKSMDVTPKQLTDVSSGDVITDRKLQDLAFIYEKFEEYMHEAALTQEDRLNIAIENAGGCKFIAESDVYILHFDLMTAQMARFAARIAQTAKNTVITFMDTHPGDPDAGLFEAARDERTRLAKMIGGEIKTVRLPQDSRMPEDIAHIERNIYAYPYAVYEKECKNVRIIAALNPEEEVCAAAEIIARLVLENGYVMQDIAVVCASPAEYSDLIKKHFTGANIPFFLDDKRNTGQNFIAGFITSALETAGGRLSKEKLIAHIEFAWGLDSPYVHVLKNYAFQRVAGAYQFEKPFPDAAAEEARVRCALPALAFRKKITASGTTRECIACLEEYMGEMRLETRLLKYIKEFENLGMFEAADYYEQAYKKIGEVLKEAEDILGDLKLTPHELAVILKSGFESASISLIPQGADEVVIGDIGVSRLKDIKTLIVLGVNEGKIPNYEEETGILLPRERDFIMQEILHVSRTSAIARQKTAIYRMFSLPQDMLILSYPACSDGEQLQPSMLIGRLEELLPVTEENASDLIGSLRENAVLLAAGELRNIADGYPNKDKTYMANLLAREDTRQTVLHYENFAARTNAAHRVVRAEDLYGGGIASASRYEAYYTCPFRHYVLYGLKPEVPREYNLASVDVGNFVHGVLDTFSKSLKESGRTWDKLSRGELVSLLRESADAVRERDFKYTLSPKNKNVLRVVERELYWALTAICRHFETSCLKMEETEHRFELDIGGVRLKGVIDRIDTARIGDELYFKVVDYKTGDKEWSLSDFAEGLSLQLVIYMLAGMEYMKQNYEGALAAGADYFTVKLPLLEEYDTEKIITQFRMNGLQAVGPEAAKQIYGYDGSGIVSLSLRLKKDGNYHGTDAKDIYTQEEISRLLSYAKTLIVRAAGEISSGDTRIAPVAGEKNIPPCRYCDFKSVCMLDESMQPKKKDKSTREDLLGSMREPQK
jgi:ATP-dependent helicase/nuclease subunit B